MISPLIILLSVERKQKVKHYKGIQSCKHLTESYLSVDWS
jgi:hypothetical protein